jgi:hypothetical protein
MKSTLFFTLVLLSSSALQANPVARKLVAQAIKQAGRETLEAGARDAAEHAAATAISKFGAAGAEELVERGGLELLEAGAKHGDDILKAARRVPEATRYLGASPAEALGLITRYSDDALRLESRVPGMAEQAVAQFGRGELAVLAKAPSSEITQLVGYASRADSPATRLVLLESWKKNGAAFLRKLDQHKTLILTGGLTVSMIKVADGVEEGTRLLPYRIPTEAMTTFFSKAGTGVSMSLMLGSVTLPLALLWLLRSRRLTHARPPSSSQASN